MLTDKPWRYMQRFLQSRVGQPWDKVYSELCRNIHRAPESDKKMILASRYSHPVEEHCWRGSDGGVYAVGYQKVQRIDVTSVTHWRTGQYYVEPETGILREPRYVAAPVKVVPIEEIQLPNNEFYRKIACIWYHVAYIKHPQYERDHVRRVFRTWDSPEEIKRQLSKKELRELRKRYRI